MNKKNPPDLDTLEVSRLKRRYLVWLYKTIKEQLDRIDRKFTQLDVDRKIYEQLKRVKVLGDKSNWDKLLCDFSDYIAKKEKDAISSKFIDSNSGLRADYLFLKTKFVALEKIIIKEFGKRALLEIKSMYEDEFVRRILEERVHK